MQEMLLIFYAYAALIVPIAIVPPPFPSSHSRCRTFLPATALCSKADADFRIENG